MRPSSVTPLAFLSSPSTAAFSLSMTLFSMLFLAPNWFNDLDDPVGISNFANIDGKLLKTYDYIVVGGGASGCVVAARLSEDPNVTVLLLEAGGHGSHVNYVPGLAGLLYLDDSPIDWRCKTETSDKFCLGSKHERCSWHRGRILGGSSAVNDLAYVRGNRKDYDNWNALGNYGWSYDEVLPYFKRSERQHLKHLVNDTRYHSTKGPLDVGDFPYKTDSARAFLLAAKDMNQTINPDLNGDSQLGFSFYPATVKRGRRVSTATAYIRPARRRPNLHVVLTATVEKVLVEGASATGVVFHRKGRRYSPGCRREVVLSAGAIETPKLLMLSGIGPREHLEQHGIEVVRDLPVGLNQQAHIANAEVVFTLDDFVSYSPLSLLNPFNQLSYLLFGAGPATTHGLEGFGFIRLNDSSFANVTSSSPSSQRPDIQIYFLSIHLASDGGLLLRRNQQDLKDAQWEQYSPLSFKPGFTLLPMLLHPKSRGKVSLRSANFRDHPIIEPNHFDHPDDMRAMVAATRFCLELGASFAFARYGGEFYSRPSPFCESATPLWSDAYWECVIRHHTWPAYDDAGTCRMGPPADPLAVVDPELRVYGVPNLRVADACIMPEITSGSIVAPSVMIGEKAADLIKSTAKLETSSNSSLPPNESSLPKEDL